MENNPQIVNRVIRDVSAFREMYFHFFMKRASAIAVTVISALYFIPGISIFFYYLFGVGIFYVNYLVLTLIFLILMSYGSLWYLVYSRSAKKQIGEKEPEPTILQIANGSIFDEGGQEIISLRMVRKAYVTKNLIYLKSGRGLIFFSRTDFVLGDEKELLSYLARFNIRLSSSAKKALMSAPSCDAESQNKE